VDNPFDAHVTTGGDTLAALVREAQQEMTAPAERRRTGGRHWSKADNEAQYAAVIVCMLDENVGFAAACNRVGDSVGRQRSSFRTAMEEIARREKATRLLRIS